MEPPDACGVVLPGHDDLRAPTHERIKDAAFRHAVALLDAGRADELRAWLHSHPQLARQHLDLPGSNYFTSPTLARRLAGRYFSGLRATNKNRCR